jgi:hypothetical protein
MKQPIEHVEGFKPAPSLQLMQAGRTLALKSVEKGGNDAQGCRVMMWYEAWAWSRLKRGRPVIL